MNRRAVLALAMLLAACGGGGSSTAPVTVPIVEVVGDSLASGHIAVPPGRLSVPPSRRLQEQLGTKALVVDYSQPGARVQDAIDGSPTMPLDPWAVHLRDVHSDIIVIRLGGADAVLGTTPEAFEAGLLQMVQAAQVVNRRVLLVGLIHLPAYETAMTDLDAAIQRVAATTGVPFSDTRSVPQGAFADQVHPDQEYADALVSVIATSVAAMLH